MTGTSKAVVFNEPGDLDVREFPVPEIDETEAILDVEATGVCATDAKRFDGGISFPEGLVPGHEICGSIAEIGDEAREAYGVERGDRVVVAPSIRCFECEPCLRNEPMFCENRRSYGTTMTADVPPHLWGGYGEKLYVAPGSILIPVSDSVPPAVGTLVSAVLGNGVRWTDEGEHRLSCEPILIQGPGPQGLAATIAADYRGASPIIVTGKNDGDRLAMARRCGADVTIDKADASGPIEDTVRDVLDGDLPPTVLDVTGTGAGIQSSLGLVAVDGTVVVAGVLPEGETVPIDFNEAVYDDVTIRSVFTHRIPHARDAVEILESGEYPFEDLVTHRYDLEDIETALEDVGSGGDGSSPLIKAVIEGT